MKLPRVECGKCGRPVAAGPVAGRISKGRLWRHDAPGIRRDADGVLVSCAGSLELVDIELPVAQLMFDLDGPAPDCPDGEPGLFVI
ncbi:hypothetical protein OV450_1368 [Actinobacteria bacterium OV450]|nr:hypothetical protein OV450_1368 [Actinobacteria bacterium OV450]